MHLFDRITSNTILLTPNSRLSAVLLKKHHEWQMMQGKLCWPSLDSLPLTSWLHRLWREFTAKNISQHPILLSSNQEQLIWEDILQQSPENEYLLQISSTAELAKSAWKTLKEWRVDIKQSGLCTTEDSVIFQQWAKQFQEVCDERNWVDSTSLADLIVNKIQEGTVTPPAHIIVIGFTEIPPQHQYLLDICTQFGSDVIYHEPDPIVGSAWRISLADEEVEIRTMARWAKATLEQHSNKVIGCVIPELKKLRSQVLQIFSEVFSAENTYTLNHTTLPFNISAGKKLTEYPIVHTALQLLHLNSKNIPTDALSSIFRSPFLGEAEREMLSRARIENTLRNNNVVTISLQELMVPKKNFDLSHDCPALAKRIREYLDSFNTIPKALPISQWVAIFMDQLTILGWPGERSLNSHEYQVVKNAWLKLLDEYASYDNVLGNVHYQQALHYLTYLATKEIFQPQSPEAPIQILGALEAADIPFDYMWVMGLDDTTWPSAPKPNPFIPPHLQKTLHMPHATAEKELTYCQRLTEQFKRSASNIIFSHSLHDAETELRVSPIISNVREITLDELTLVEFVSPAQRIFASKALEHIVDATSPPIFPEEKIRGGTTIFKLQAACPFKAFTEIRLHARKIDSPTLGLRAKDRGEIIHKVMEMLWRELRDSETLENTSAEALSLLIEASVEKALAIVANESIKNPRYRILESLRLQKLVGEWLEKEKNRHSFTVVAQEQERQATVGNIPITFRIDRIDQLDNGKHVIIDYKTGKDNSPNAWFGNRPDEPQLPLYCVADPENIIGILFAQINVEKMKWEGLSELTLGVDSVKTLSKMKHTSAVTWQEQIQQWQMTLEKLGDDFIQGIATVDPKDSIETCRHCHLKTFCRVHEARMWDEA